VLRALFGLASVLVRAETALVAEFEPIGEDPEKFNAFCSRVA